MIIRIVCATKSSEEAFFSDTALGRSLRRFTAYKDQFELRVFANNSLGLPEVYNQAIAETVNVPRILVFMHDDIHLCDLFWPQRLAEGLAVFDIVGVVGNTRRLPRQPSWALVFQGDTIVWDERRHFSGSVAYGKGIPAEQIDVFGPSGQEVKLLDGLFLAASSETLHRSALRFDQQFKFHFYDLDFCRQAENLGLRMGTWPISLVHESSGSFSPAWLTELTTYQNKWPE